MKRQNSQTKKLESLKAFIRDTILSFGINSLVEAVMVPPALGKNLMWLARTWSEQRILHSQLPNSNSKEFNL